MKRLFTRWLLLPLLSFALAVPAAGQQEINSDFITQTQNVFSGLEKFRVPYGLMLDYAMELADVKSYNGVLTDSNKVNTGILQNLYATMAMSAVHTNAGGFYGPDYADSLWQSWRQPGVICLSGVHYNYSRLRDDAARNNLVTISNGVVYDRYVRKGVWINPYQTETVFAMSPPLHAYSGKNLRIYLPGDLWFTNNAGAVSSIEVDFGDNNGYQVLMPNQQLPVTYADTGLKTWVFKLSLTDGSTLYSHTEMQIAPEPNSYAGGAGARFQRPGGAFLLTADEAFNGQFGQGWVTVDYANPPDAGGNLRLSRPLIVIEGLDPGRLLTPELQFGVSDFAQFSSQILNSGSSDLRDLLQGGLQQYDIIYIDYFNGTDFLQRNGLMVERVIRWVNEQKAIDGSIEPNVVLGQSMGGVIGRWVLRDMENKGLNHQARLFVSYDSPQQGANIPVALQHLYRHGSNLYLQTNIPLLLGGTNINRLVRSVSSLLDEPAPRQMLYNRVADNGQLTNADHDTWQAALRTMGYPQQCRNIAVSNGSECGIGQGFAPGANLLDINGRANTRFLSELIMSTVGSGITALGLNAVSFILNRPQFLLGIVPGRNDLFFELNCKAQPANASGQIYKGKITYRKKVFYLIDINTSITNRTRNADPNVLPIDGTPGGMFDTELNLQNASFQNWAVKYNLNASSIPNFNFIPTVSALDIGGGNTPLVVADFQARYVGATPPAAPLNTPFANFTTAFNQITISNGGISNNENHIQIAARNGNWLAQELQGNINIRSNCSGACANNNFVMVGSTIICNSSDYSISNLPLGASVIWSIPGSAGNTLQLAQNTPNLNELRITNQHFYQVQTTLTATITFGTDCGNPVVITKEIINDNEGSSGSGSYNYYQESCTFYNVSHPSQSGTVGNGSPVFVHQGCRVYVTMDNMLGKTISFTGGTQPQSWGVSPGTNSRTLYFQLPYGSGGIPFTWKVAGDGACIEKTLLFFSYTGNGRYSYAATPNPAKNSMTINAQENEKYLAEKKLSSNKESIHFLMNVYDFNTHTLKLTARSGKGNLQHRLNIASLTPGYYILQIIEGDETQTIKFLKE